MNFNTIHALYYDLYEAIKEKYKDACAPSFKGLVKSDSKYAFSNNEFESFTLFCMAFHGYFYYENSDKDHIKKFTDDLAHRLSNLFEPINQTGDKKNYITQLMNILPKVINVLAKVRDSDSPLFIPNTIDHQSNTNEAENDEIKEKLEQFKKDNEKTMEEKNDEINTIKEEFEHLKEVNKKITEEKDNAIAENSSLKGELDKAKEELTQTKEQLDKTKEQHAETDKELAQTKEQLAKATNKFTKYKKELQEKSEADIKAFFEQKEEEIKEKYGPVKLNELKSKLVKQNEIIKVLKTQDQRQKSELGAISSQFEELNKNFLMEQKRSNNLEKRKKKLEDKYNVLAVKYNGIQSKYIEMAKDREELIEENEDLRSQIEELKENEKILTNV